jgi:NADH-quinone oxidoreductase subunit L
LTGLYTFRLYFIVFAGEPKAEPHLHNGREAPQTMLVPVGILTVLAVALGLAGMAVAWAVYSEGRLSVPRIPALQRALEHKLYFDEAYDRLFYAPTAAIANYLRGTTEEQWILPVGGEFGEVTLQGGRLTRRLQTGLLRTYVLFLGTGMAVMAIVFLLVR